MDLEPWHVDLDQYTAFQGIKLLLKMEHIGKWRRRRGVSVVAVLRADPGFERKSVMVFPEDFEVEQEYASKQSCCSQG